MTYQIHLGSNLDVLPTLPDNSVDSIVTDPPYELGFMGKKWDNSGIAFSVELWVECLRVLKPGGHILAFSGSRTYHRMVVAIEDAGFEVRDMISWISNKTFPKSHNLKDEWQGWGTGLKPTVEPVVLARKPLIGTVLENVLEHGTGALNIDGSRIGTEQRTYVGATKLMEQRPWSNEQETKPEFTVQGRWPANIILDEQAAELLDEQSDASRFFYVAKASKRDRNEGLEDLEPTRHSDRKNADGVGGDNPRNRTNEARQNFHPTVKPTNLMRYLVKLVTPPNGTVLDPFTGSGSTGKAAILEGFDFIGIEMTEDYIPIIEGRLAHAEKMRAEAEAKKDEGLF